MKKYLFVLLLIAFFVPAFHQANAQEFSFDQNMSLGNSGPAVSDLQTWLIQNGFDIRAISMGRTPKGYFGIQTRDALAAYQRSIGLPAYGYFGPMTRNYFRMHRGQSLRVTSPNGGEVWETGSTQNITWTGSPGILSQTGTIRAMFYVPPCAEPTFSGIRCYIAVRQPVLIADNVNLSSGSYSWRVGSYKETVTANNMGASPDLVDGQYKIQICPNNSNSCDQSDNYFNITSTSTPVGQAPVISSVSGPTSLSAGQTGSWSIGASDPQNQSLTYSVDWGDNVAVGSAQATPPSSNFVQTATFTHIYSYAGNYTVRFSVRNTAGQTSQSTLTVQVTGTTTTAGPLKITSPNGGETWQRGTVQRITWTSPYYIRATYADLKLLSAVACTANNPCVAAAYNIASGVNINQNFLDWSVGSSLQGASIPDGNYLIQICESGTNSCSSSNVFNIRTATTLLQVCPNERIINMMPGTSAPSSYYILNGQRRELNEFDQNWVSNHCNVPTQTVY